MLKLNDIEIELILDALARTYPTMWKEGKFKYLIDKLKGEINNEQ